MTAAKGSSTTRKVRPQQYFSIYPPSRALVHIMTNDHRSSSWTEITCRQCGNKREVRRCYVERGQMKYCSRQCCALARRTRGTEPVEYEGGTFNLDGQGYFVSKRTGRVLHRVIWEAHH